jgi:hypothetical protein
MAVQIKEGIDLFLGGTFGQGISKVAMQRVLEGIIIDNSRVIHGVQMTGQGV